MSRAKMLIAAALMSLAACGSPTLAPVPDSFEAAVTDTTSEGALHMAKVNGAADMVEVAAEAERHAAVADVLYGEMRVHVEGAQGCEVAVRDELVRLMNGVDATERGEREALAHSISTTEARGYARAYTGGVGELIGKMNDRWRTAHCY